MNDHEKGYRWTNTVIRYDDDIYHRWRKRFMHFVQCTNREITGTEAIPEGPAILAANHLNWKDVILIACSFERPVSFVATTRLFERDSCISMLDQYARQKLGGKYLERIYHPVNNRLAGFLVSKVSKSGAVPAMLRRKDYSLLEAIKEKFRKGYLMCIFPEGRPGKVRMLNRFKLGLSRVLYEYNRETRESLPVFPVGILGTEKFYHPGMPLRLTVGTPLYIHDFVHLKRGEALLAFTDTLKAAIQNLTLLQS